MTTKVEKALAEAKLLLEAAESLAGFVAHHENVIAPEGLQALREQIKAVRAASTRQSAKALYLERQR